MKTGEKTHAVSKNSSDNNLGGMPGDNRTSASGDDIGVTQLSGAIEVEAGFTDGAGGSESDISVPTVELGVDNQINSRVNGHVLFLFGEGDSESPEVDEAIITFAHSEQSSSTISAGRMYVPFGAFSSALLSDPLTLEIGETRETAIFIGTGNGNLQLGVWLANGDTKDSDDETIGLFGFSMDYVINEEQGSALGISWISNLADSNSLQDAVTDPDNLVDAVAGFSVYATTHWQNFTLTGEYLSAADDFNAADLAFDGSGARPSAWNLEVGYGFEMTGREAEVAMAWQQSDEALALELPEKRWLAALSVGIYDQTTLALEYAHDEDYGTDDGGSGEDTDTVTLQLAASF